MACLGFLFCNWEKLGEFGLGVIGRGGRKTLRSKIMCRSPLTLMWLCSNSRVDLRGHHTLPQAMDVTSSLNCSGGEGSVGTSKPSAGDSVGLLRPVTLS